MTIDSRFYTQAQTLCLADIIQFTQSRLIQEFNQNTCVQNVATLKQACSSDITVLNNAKYQHQLSETNALACFVTEKDAKKCPDHTLALVCKSPYRAFALTAQAFYPDVDRYFDASFSSIHPSAQIDDNCTIEHGVIIHAGVHIQSGTRIGAYSVIGRGVQIGHNCVVESHATITHSLIGDHVTVFTGSRIGQAGFGFFMDESGHVKVPQLGRVIVHDYVEIGANTTVDRGSLSDTIIGPGCRIDNLVQIAHNVQLGRGCVVVAQVGIAGSTHIDDYTIIAGQVGISGHLKIGKRVKIAAQSGVMRDIMDGEVVAGSPAVSVTQWHRQTIALKRLTQSKDKRTL